MKEVGKLDRLKKKWAVKFHTDCRGSEDDTKPLAIKDVFVAFIVLLIAMGATFLLVQLERIDARNKASRMR